MPITTLRLILGDQLSQQISSLQDYNHDSDIVCLAEVMSEAHYAPHHKKKLVFFFSAMRHFASELKERNFRIHYHHLTTTSSFKTFSEVILDLKHKHPDIDRIVVTEPGEHRLLLEIQSWQKKLGVQIDIRPDNRFISSTSAFSEWAQGRKTLTMEYFYRKLRKESGLLMKDGEPVGGQWNFDKENRKKLDKEGKTELRDPLSFDTDTITQQVIKLVEQRFPENPGSIEPFNLPVTTAQAKELLSDFLEKRLPRFGKYQDAMLQNQPFLFHSLIAPALNTGLLDPLDVCKRAEECYFQDKAPINAVEGFIRQILGWREYIRGIYWLHMPEYAEMNYLDAKRSLPDFYWTGETEMNCLSQVVKMTMEHGYSHHIQRLMVTGNYALLSGLDVKQVHQWYLGVYNDAIEWVELPNTLGMALHADGGIVGTKPYISSGAYINRMSDFCRDCSLDVKSRTGENACPFNCLYWNFLHRHRARFRNNRRMALMYKNLERINGNELNQINSMAERHLDSVKSDYSN
jgi:deoxyribodipyrimidine photolyase-related protein